ncbi:MAG: archaeal proteasome endopeptidase complex subunit beta [Candidatus Diapherotrites archaeon]|nr:archaeal proteasome endopeptidase complex subunit beta [Candidatus Diapherotrites archaeon]
MDKENTKHGTTTLGLKCKDGVILASESRATMGNLIANKDTPKIFRLQDHIWMTTAGSVADAQKLVRIMQVETNLYQIERDHPMKVDAAVSLLSNILHGNKWFPYWVQLLIGGYDTGPRLYSLDAVGSALEEKVVATGSGSPFAYGLLEAQYSEGGTVDENVPVAVKAIKSALERDAFSGNNIKLVAITKSGYKKIDPAPYLK